MYSRYYFGSHLIINATGAGNNERRRRLRHLSHVQGVRAVGTSTMTTTTTTYLWTYTYLLMIWCYDGM